MIKKSDLIELAKSDFFNLTDEEYQKLSNEFDDIINQFDFIKSINTENIEPTNYILTISDNVLREDEIELFNNNEILDNSKNVINKYVVVK